MSESYTYTAFLSYSHRDKKVGAWLHRQLESYKIPKALVGKQVEQGLVPARLGRVFRDQDELPVTDDLTAEVQKALASSQCMIVLCSPASAASRWVNKEVIEFKKLRGDKFIFPLIIEGEPFASKKGRPEAECFPPAVRYKLGPDGLLSAVELEPAAADLRKEADGKHRALLKLIAGIVGVGLDQLVEREMRRKQRRVMTITASSVVAMIVMSVLTVEAISARRAADRNRGEAEDLIEFMLTDLRSKLEPVGRLDALDVVGEKVLDYYENQAKYEAVPDDSIGRKARAYHLLGEMQLQRDHLGDATDLFKRSTMATEELLKRDPNNTQRIFEHAQSVFWVGEHSFNQRNFSEMGRAFQEYKRLVDMLVAKEPDNLDWQIEKAYGNLNMGTVYYYRDDNPRKALPHLMMALQSFEAAYIKRPDSSQLLADITNTHNFVYAMMRQTAPVSDVQRKLSQFKSDIMLSLQRDPESQFAKLGLIDWYLTQAVLYSDENQFELALDRVQVTINQVTEWLQFEQEASMPLRLKARAYLHAAQYSIELGKFEQAEAYLKRAAHIYSDKLDMAPWWQNLRLHAVALGLGIQYAQNNLKVTSPDFEKIDQDFQKYEDILRITQFGRDVLSFFYHIKIKSFVAIGDVASAMQARDKLWQLVDGDNRDQVPPILKRLNGISKMLGDAESHHEIHTVLLERGYLGVPTAVEN